MRRILLTGVTGFVGSTLVHHFADRPDVQLFGHSRDLTKAKAQFDSVPIEIIDGDPGDQLDKLQIDCIIHLAGIAHDLSNTFVDADYFRVNYERTARLYDAFLASGAKTFIYFSSIKAVVDSIDTPLQEDVVPNPTTAYGKSKLRAEQYIISHTVSTKDFYILRPCMIHGSGNKGNLNLLYKFVKSGIPYPLGAFQNRRSLLGASNLAFIIEQLIQKQIASDIYNIADGESLSTSDIVQTIALTLKRRPRIWNLPCGPIRAMFRLAGKEKTLLKLTGNMEVSNEKLLRALQTSLPSTAREGLKKTIMSFHE